jgi:hypothetical protein
MRRRGGPDGTGPGNADDHPMSAIHPHHPHTHAASETSGEQIFFAMAGAFGVVLAAILAGFFLPVGFAVAMIFVVLAVVLVAVGAFLGRILGD